MASNHPSCLQGSIHYSFCLFKKVPESSELNNT
jgi:hypothetical protein